jgi:hypothetical protein
MRNPHDRWLAAGVAGSFAAALIIGWTFHVTRVRAASMHRLPKEVREVLAAVPLQPERTLALEHEWMAEFEPELLVAPAGPMPCASAAAELVAPADRAVAHDAFFATTGDRQARIERLASIAEVRPQLALVTLMLATELISAERFDEAERVALRVVRRSPNDLRNIATSDVSIALHLYHATGVAQLSRSTQPPSAGSLRMALAAADVLRRRRVLGRRRGDSVARDVVVPRLGCSTSPEGLSVDDLRNNLIVAYMRGANPGETHRSPQWPDVPSTALQRLVHIHGGAGTLVRDPQLAALSEVERAVAEGVPDDARLAVNAVQVIDWWTAPGRCDPKRCTAALRAELDDLRHALLERALARRNVTPAQQAAFARSMARLLTDSALPGNRLAGAAIAEWLPPAQAAKFTQLLASRRGRVDYPQWIAGSWSPFRPAPHEGTGPYADRWLAAAAWDYARAASAAVRRLPPEEQGRALIALRRLAGKQGIPPELERLEFELPFATKLVVRRSASARVWLTEAIFLAAGTWLAMVWVLVQMWERRVAKTSLYNVELEQLRRRDQRRRP